jgi:Uma2 family endonuclease
MEVGYRLGPNSWAQPDVSVPYCDQKVDKYYLASPILAIEVISEANRAKDIAQKLVRYFEHGAEEVWLVYPEVHCIEVHHEFSSAKHTETFACRCLDGVPVNVKELLK